MEVDGGIMEGVSAGLSGAGARRSVAWRWGLHSTSLVSSPRCSAGRPDPQGLHRPELPPGPPLARAEDPRWPQHAGPQVPRAGGEPDLAESRSAGWEARDQCPGCGAEDTPAVSRVQPLPSFSVPKTGCGLSLGRIETW